MAAQGGTGVMAGRGAMTTHHYRCTNGHGVASPRPVETCPACVKGKPCDGELRRIGPGSRAKKVSA